MESERSRGKTERTYHKMKKMKVIVIIMVEYAATDNVCNLLFLGTLAGTNLEE